MTATPGEEYTTGAARSTSASPGGERLVKHASLRLLAEIVGRCLWALFMIVAARLLGPASFGAYNVALAWAALFTHFTDFGTQTLLARDLAASDIPRGRLVGTTLLLDATLAGIAFGVGIALHHVLRVPVPMEWTAAALAGGVAFYLWTACGASLRAMDAIHLEAAGTLVQRLLTVVSGFAVLLAGGGVAEVLVAMAAANLLTTLAAVLVIRRSFVTQFALSLGLAWRILRDAAPLGVATIVAVVYLRLDTLLLTALASAEAAGTYNAAFRFVEAALVVPGVAMAALLPTFTRAAREGEARLWSMVGQVLRVVIVLVGPAVVLAVVLAEPIMRVVYGPEYGGATALRLLSVMLLLSCVTSGYVTVLVVQGRQSAYPKATGVALLLSLAVDVTLIPRLGDVGAAIGKLVGEIVLLGLLRHVALLRTGRTPWSSALRGPAMALGVLAAWLVVLWSWPLVAMTGAPVVYLGALAWLGGVSAEERRFLRVLLRRRPSAQRTA